MRKVWLLLTVAGLAVGATVGAGMAQARLDTSFGQGGVVEVRPPLPAPWRDQYVRSMAAARNGDSFVLAQRLDCAGLGGCSSAYVLFRYLRDGSLDPTFGGPSGSYGLPRGGDWNTALAVDSAGRPLLLQASADRVAIRRLTRSGAPDGSFGVEGAVEFECRCEYGAQLAPGPRGTVTVVLRRARFGIGRRGSLERTGTVFTLTRLGSDGSRDRRFGGNGTSAFGLRGAEFPVYAMIARGGALYLSGAGCCGSGLPGYVARISARGRLDGRFTAASQRSLRVVRPLSLFEGSVNAVLVGSGGRIDLLGSTGYEKGFVLRLNPDGTRNRRSGASGLRTLPSPVASAALGTGGATLAVGDDGRGFSTLMRIFPNGRLDPAFGARGRRIPGSGGDSGVSVVAQTGGKALVLNLGLQECRVFCRPDPKLIRFLEGSPKLR